MSETVRPSNAVASAIIICLAPAVVILAVLLGLERSKHSLPPPSVVATEALFPLPGEQVILRYTGGEIKVKDLPDDITVRVREQTTDLYKKSAEKILLEKLLIAEAKKRDLPGVEALLESIGQTNPVTEADITAFMKKNDLENGFKDPATGTIRKVERQEIRDHLIKKNHVVETQTYLAELLAAANVDWTVDRLTPARTTIGSDDPVLGDRHAPVVIFEYSDFQCPFCAQAQPALNQIRKAYGDKVALVFRHLPLDMHPAARSAALASVCAQEQGKFWEFHNQLFQNQELLDVENYLAWAKKLGLDEHKFAACMSSAGAQEALGKSLNASLSAGVDSVPTFIVATTEGEQKLHGARSFAEFKGLIDASLH